MSFKILHLSDAHLGSREGDERLVIGPLHERIREDAEKLGPPNLIVFSGDLVWGQENGKPKPITEQFESAREFLDKIYKDVGVEQSAAPLLLVPGNHDLSRDEIKVADRNYLQDLTRAKVDALVKENRNGACWDRQKAFADFAATYTAPSHWERDTRWITSKRVFEHEGKEIGIVGLNSSWTSFSSSERGNLWIGDPQKEQALGFAPDVAFRILVTHHPSSWWNEEEQTLLQAQLESHFHLHMHGHEHFGWFTDPTGHIRVAAGACYQGSRLPSGFNWIEVSLAENAERVKLHLREFRGETRVWIPRDLGPKAPGGVADLDSPWRKRPDSSAIRRALSERSRSPAVSAQDRPFVELQNGTEFCQALQNHYLAEVGNPYIPSNQEIEHVYWPVRRRNPNVVHAAQAIIAAGLALKGAKVSLWIDDVGKDQDDAQRQLLNNKLRLWYEKAGGPPTLVTKNISDLMQDDAAKATCETFRRWLSDHDGRSMKKVLEISKVIRTPSPSLNDILTGTPNRLLNPPLVWTGLSHTIETVPVSGLATLSGLDERELWKTWSVVYPQPNKAVTHVYCAKITDATGLTVPMEDLEWRGRREVEENLRKELLHSSHPQDFLKRDGIAHWCFTHFVALPAYLQGSMAVLTLPSRAVSEWGDLGLQDANDLPACLAEAIAPWIS